MFLGIRSSDLPQVCYSDTLCTTSLFHLVRTQLLQKLVYTVFCYLEINLNYFQTDLAYQYFRLLCCDLCDVRYTRINFSPEAFSTAVRVQFCPFAFTYLLFKDQISAPHTHSATPTHTHLAKPNYALSMCSKLWHTAARRNPF